MIAIIAILAVVVVLALNPAQLLAQSRDANRFADLATLNSAINLYAQYQGSSAIGTSSVTYFSIPDMTATSSAGTQCGGLGGNFLSDIWSHCAASSTDRNINGQGWIPINFSSIPAGSPFGSLPVDPVNSTSSNLYYSYQTNGNTFRLVALPESQKYLLSVGANPTMFMLGSNPALYGGSWVIVPGNSTFGTNNFYVMKYDAACANNTTGIALTTPTDVSSGYQDNYSPSTTNCIPTSNLDPASLPNAIPIVDISQTDAATYCANIGAHLITNNEWQTIAWNLENQASNWNGGVVGQSFMYSGHNDGNPPQISVASSDDTQGYFGTSGATNQRRTLTLSDGAVIWDMAGNIWEWTNNTILDTQEPHGVATGWNRTEFTDVTSWGSMTQQTAGPSNTTWNSGQGVGSIYSVNNRGTGVTDGFLRGGVYEFSPYLAGVEGIHLQYAPSLQSSGFGFRCAR